MTSSTNTSISQLTDPTLSDSSFSEDNEEYLNALGTRPPIPYEFTLKDEYMPIIGLFHCCTEEDPNKRPSASTIVTALKPFIEQKGIKI